MRGGRSSATGETEGCGGTYSERTEDPLCPRHDQPVGMRHARRLDDLGELRYAQGTGRRVLRRVRPGDS